MSSTPIAHRLADAGIRVTSITVASPTLDDVYLKVLGHRLSDESDRPRMPTAGEDGDK